MSKLQTEIDKILAARNNEPTYSMVEMQSDYGMYLHGIQFSPFATNFKVAQSAHSISLIDYFIEPLWSALWRISQVDHHHMRKYKLFM